MAGDDDKTVFGQKLPVPPPRQGQGGQAQPPSPQQPAPPPQQPPQQPPAQRGGEKTVFGQQMPPAGGARAAPSAPQRPAHGAEDTWLGGALDPQGYQPQGYQQPQYQQPQPSQQQGYGAQYQPQSVYPQGAGPEMFPTVPNPQDQQPQQMQQPRIALQDALRATGLGKGGSSNPLVAAAANLLILLGRLRTGLVEMQSGPLIDHVTREIDLYERNLLEVGVNAQDASDAKYVLSATADDIVQNLPGADRSIWIQYSMVARFFGERSSGVGFFQKVDAAMKAPGQKFYLLELMLTCLSLGFEGQFRTAPNGNVELTRVRNAIYETLRRVQPRPDDDISVRWAGVPLGKRRRFGGTPVWVIAAVASVLVVALFATLSTLLTRQGSDVQQGILALHQGQPPIIIERTSPVVEAYVAPESTQLERIREGLAAQLDAGEVVVDRKNEFIFVRLGDVLRFGSGSAELESQFSELAEAVATTLEGEPGPILVVGHTDSIPPSGRGRYKSNEELSVARAETVGEVLRGYLSDPDRVETEGKGAVDPIADNGTREGRAANRRVEIMVMREDAL